MDAQRIVETSTTATATVMGAAAAASIFATGQRTALQVNYQMTEDQLRYLQSSTSGQVLVTGTKGALKGGTHPAMRQAREWLYSPLISVVAKYDAAALQQGGKILVVFATLADIKRFNAFQSVHFLFSYAELDDAGRCFVAQPGFEYGSNESFVKRFPALLGRLHNSLQTVGQADMVIFADCTYSMSNEMVTTILSTVGAKIGFNIMVLPDAIIYRDDPENHVDNPLHRIERSDHSMQSYQSFATEWERDTISFQYRALQDPIAVVKYMEKHSRLPVGLRVKVAAATMGLPSTRLVWTNVRGGGDKVYDEVHALWREKANPVYKGDTCWVNQLEFSSASMRLFKLSPAFGAGVRVVSYCLPEVDRHVSVLDLGKSVHQFNKSVKTVAAGGLYPGRKAAPVYRSVRLQCVMATIDYLSRQPMLTLEEFDKAVDLSAAHLNRQNATQSLLQVEKGSFVPPPIRDPRSLAMVLVMNELHHRQHAGMDLAALLDQSSFLGWIKKCIGAFAPALLKNFIKWCMGLRTVDFWVEPVDHVLQIEDAVNCSALKIVTSPFVTPILYPVNVVATNAGLYNPVTEVQLESRTDGNCGPCSLATLEGAPGEHERVRAEVVDYVRKYSHRYVEMAAVDAQWLADMSRDGVWFDATAMLAWSELRHRRLGVWDTNVVTGDREFRWVCGPIDAPPAILTWLYRQAPDVLIPSKRSAEEDQGAGMRALFDDVCEEDAPKYRKGGRDGIHFQPCVNPPAPEGENGQEKLFEADSAVCASACASRCSFVVVVGVSPGSHWTRLLELYPALTVVGYDEADCKIKHPRFIWHKRLMTPAIASTLANERVALIFDHRTVSAGREDPSALDKMRDNVLAVNIVLAMKPCIVSYKVACGHVAADDIPPVFSSDPTISLALEENGDCHSWFGIVGDEQHVSYQHYTRLGSSELRCLTSNPRKILKIPAVRIRSLVWKGDLLRVKNPIAAVVSVAKSKCSTCGKLGYAKTCRDCLTDAKQAVAVLEDNQDCPLCRAALALGTTSGNFIPPASHECALHVKLGEDDVNQWKAGFIEQLQQATAGLNKVLAEAQEAIKPIKSIDVNVNVFQMNGTPGCGKTKLMIQVMRELHASGVDKVLVVIPMLKLLSEYQNIEGLPMSFYEVKTPHKALTYLSGNKPQWILYDELGAMQFQLVAFSMGLAGEGSNHVLVGDKNQTRVRANEGDEFWNNLSGSAHIDFDKCGVHFSCANYRNPRSVVEKANAYITESAKMVAMSSRMGGIGYVNMVDAVDGVTLTELVGRYGVELDAKDTLNMVFAKKTWVQFRPDQGEDDAVTVRTCQGQTTRNAVLHLTHHANMLMKNNPQCLVALTRATEWLIIVVHDNDATSIAWAQALRTDMETLTGGSMVPDWRAIPDDIVIEDTLPDCEVRPAFDAFYRYRDARGFPLDAEVAKLIVKQAKPLAGKFQAVVRDSPLQTDSDDVKEFQFVTNPISSDIVPQMRTDAMEARTALKRIAQVSVKKPLTALDREVLKAKMDEFFRLHKHSLALPTSVLHELDRFDENAKQKHYIERILGDLEAKPYEELLHNYVQTLDSAGYLSAAVRAGMKEQVKVSNVNKEPDWSKVGQAISCFPAQMIVKSSLLVRVLAAVDQQSYNSTGLNRVHLKQRVSDQEFRKTAATSLARVFCAQVSYSDGGEMDVGNTEAGWYLVKLYIEGLFQLCPEAELMFPNWRAAWDEMVDLSTDVRVVFRQFELKSGLATPSGCSFTYFITCVLNVFWNFVCFKTHGETVRLVGGDDGITAAYKIEEDVAGQALFYRVMNISLKNIALEGSYAEFCGDLVVKIAGSVRMVPYMYRRARKILCSKVKDESHLIELQREARASAEEMRLDPLIRVVNIVALMRDGISADKAENEYDSVAEAFVSFGRCKTDEVMRGLVKLTMPMARC